MASTANRVRFIELWGQLCAYAAQLNISFIIWTFDRSPQEQNDLYKRGRTMPGPIVTNCDGYIKKSAHQHWTAIDIAIVKNGEVEWADIPEYHDLGDYWESIGGVWGGRWALNDIYHFSLEE
jgi:peptidoglycan L-alanyl-D-glutamate endopeptidase CwlK